MSADDVDYDARLALAAEELDRLVRRLRGLAAGAWRERRAPAVRALHRFVVLSSLAEHRPMAELPEVADHALADAVAVVGGDVLIALGAEPDPSLLTDLMVECRAALAATR